MSKGGGHFRAPVSTSREGGVPQTAMSHRQRVPDAVPGTAGVTQDFTNVTKLEWTHVHPHPHYGAGNDYRQLRAALQDDLARLSYEDLARLSWAVASVLGAGSGLLGNAS